MRRRTLLLLGPSLLSLSSGCLRLTEEEEEALDETNREDENTDPEDENTDPEDVDFDLTQRWNVERDVRHYNDVTATATNGDLLYFTTSEDIIALNIEDGTTAWESPHSVGPNDLILDLKLHGGELYTLGLDGTLTAFNSTNGTRNWNLVVPYTSESEMDDPNWPGVISAGPNRVIVSVFDIGSENDHPYVYAVDTSGHSVEWEIGPEMIAEYFESDYARPRGISAIVDGTVFVGFSQGTMSVGTQSGTVNWTQMDTRCNGTISVAEDSILVPGGGSLSSLARSTGEQRWSLDGGDVASQTFVSKPVVEDNSIYAAGQDTMVHSLGLQDGTENWTGETGGPILVRPAISDSDVWAGSRDGRLYAFDRSSGSRSQTELIGSPIIGFEYSGDTALVLTDGGISAFTVDN